MPEKFSLPGDLTKLSKAELAELQAKAKAELDELMSRDTSETPYTLDDAKRSTELVGFGTKIKGAFETIEAAEAKEREEIAAQMEAARGKVDEVFATAPEGGDGDGGDGGEGASANGDPAPAPEVLQGELVAAAATPKNRNGQRTLNTSLRTMRLKEVQREADGQRGNRGPAEGSASDLIITASANVPNIDKGAQFSDVNQLADTFAAYARSLPTTHGAPQYGVVATIANELVSRDTALSDRTPAAQVEEVMKRITDPSVLWSTIEDEGAWGVTKAGGGWCSPSVNRYAFFALDCQDGGIDLPTVGIERGGINFPTSPSLADVFTGEFTSGTNPWLWTETDDIANVTGSPTKPCVRVPCPDFTNVRLECYGICLTAGNLIDNAYPEAVAHQIRLLQAALFHATNTRYIQQMVALSETVVTGGAGGAGVISPVLYMVELAAVDYRTRFGMCQTDILEVVLPHWIIAAMRADATKRTGVDMVNLTDAVIADWFDTRHIRAQFVSDWQVRTTALLPGGTASGGMNTWPTSVDFLIYAAGTFVRGNGMSLNLGVVRDSTLNADNDHTALWMEECHLIARFGVQSRQYRVNICADGTTGANDLTACSP